MKKNDLLTLKIEGMGNEGEGIGKADGFPLFIKDALPGDVIRAKALKVKKTYGYGRLMEIVTASLDRTEPPCPVHRSCGGCQIQALSYEKQLEYKREKVQNQLIRLGGFSAPEVLPVLGMDEPFRYRNKAQFPFGRDREGRVVTGFYAGRTHHIVPNWDCLLGVAENQEILEILVDFMEQEGIAPYEEASGEGLVRHVLIRKGFATGELMVCLVLNGDVLPGAGELADRLFQIPGMTSFTLNVNTKNTNVILGDKLIPVRGQAYITDRIGDVQYRISPLSFYQVNPVQTKRLYETALSYAGLTGTEVVWDLYCGIGTISLFLAQKAGRVYGVEVVPQAVEDARENAALNGLSNVEFYLGKAEEVLPRQYEEKGIRADVIVVDPPRKGCGRACLDTMLSMAPERIVYVSCDSATMARDLKLLCEGGYELKKVQPVDMFPHTAGIETCVLLSQRHIDDYIRVSVELTPEDVTPAEAKATYDMIKKYVLENYKTKVSSLYIAQIKRKYGLETGESYNKPKCEKPKVPKCPADKERMIVAALKYYKML